MVFTEATDVVEKSTATEDEIKPLIEKHNSMKEAYRELGSYDLSWNARYKESYPEYSHLFEAKK